MLLTNEDRNRKIEENILQKLNLSDDIKAFRDNNKTEAKNVMDEYTEKRQNNETKNNISTAAAVITAAVAANGFIGLPLLAAGTIGIVAPLVSKNKNMKELKERAEELNTFNRESVPVDDLLLSESFKAFKRENNQDYKNSLKTIEERSNKLNLATGIGLLCSSIGCSALTFSGSVAAVPAAISIIGLIALAKVRHNKNNKEKNDLKESFDEVHFQDLEKDAKEYSELYGQLNKANEKTEPSKDILLERSLDITNEDSAKPIAVKKETKIEKSKRFKNK